MRVLHSALLIHLHRYAWSGGESVLSSDLETYRSRKSVTSSV